MHPCVGSGCSSRGVFPAARSVTVCNPENDFVLAVLCRYHGRVFSQFTFSTIPVFELDAEKSRQLLDLLDEIRKCWNFDGKRVSLASLVT